MEKFHRYLPFVIKNESHEKGPVTVAQNCDVCYEIE